MTFSGYIQAFINSISALSFVVIAIGLTWQDAFSRALEVEVSWSQRVILGLSIWLVYMGDRWFDVQIIRAHRLINKRHILIKQLAVIIRHIFLPLLIIDVGLAILTINLNQLTIGLMIFVLCVIYVRSISRSRRFLPSKEVVIGFLFGAGIFLFLIDQRTILSASFWLCFILFSALLVCNAILVGFWEVDLDHAEGQHSIAMRKPKIYRWAIGFIGLVGIIGFFSFSYIFPSIPGLSLAFLSTSFGLIFIHFLKIRVEPETMHFLADVCFLSPLVFLS